MKTLLIVLSLACYIRVTAQTSDSLAYLSNLKGKGLCIRNGAESNLKIPFFFVNGDKVKMLSGNAVLVMYNEDEISLVTGESYTVSYDKNRKPAQNDLLFYKNSKQSNSSANMRGMKDSKSAVFPKKTKIADQSKAILQVNPRYTQKYFFKLIDPENRAIVFQLTNAENHLIDLSNVVMKEGVKYTWQIKWPEKEVIGEIELMSKQKVEELPKYQLSNRASYVNAFNLYCKKEYYFEALNVIEAAKKAYPDDEYFKYLEDSLY